MIADTHSIVYNLSGSGAEFDSLITWPISWFEFKLDIEQIGTALCQRSHYHGLYRVVYEAVYTKWSHSGSYTTEMLQTDMYMREAAQIMCKDHTHLTLSYMNVFLPVKLCAQVHQYTLCSSEDWNEAHNFPFGVSVAYKSNEYKFNETILPKIDNLMRKILTT